MTTSTMSKSQSRFRRIGFGGVLCLVAGIIPYWYLKPLTPDVICARAVNALERQDAEALMRLADDEEISRLKLTPSKIRGLMSETDWRNGPLRYGSTVRSLQARDDQGNYSVAFAGKENDGSGHDLWINVLDSKDHGWRLNLGQVLWGACWRKLKSKEGAQLYIQLATKYGIDGLRGQEGPYVDLKTLKSHFPPQ